MKRLWVCQQQKWLCHRINSISRRRRRRCHRLFLRRGRHKKKNIQSARLPSEGNFVDRDNVDAVMENGISQYLFCCEIDSQQFKMNYVWLGAFLIHVEPFKRNSLAIRCFAIERWKFIKICGIRFRVNGTWLERGRGKRPTSKHEVFVAQMIACKYLKSGKSRTPTPPSPIGVSLSCLRFVVDRRYGIWQLLPSICAITNRRVPQTHFRRDHEQCSSRQTLVVLPICHTETEQKSRVTDQHSLAIK